MAIPMSAFLQSGHSTAVGPMSAMLQKRTFVVWRSRKAADRLAAEQLALGPIDGVQTGTSKSTAMGAQKQIIVCFWRFLGGFRRVTELPDCPLHWRETKQ
jgi:hypothetical protein